MRAYHAALAKRGLSSGEPIRTTDLAARLADAEALVNAGRDEEAIAKLTEIVEHPQFDLAAETQEGRAALYLLGHALASSGIDESARAYLKRSIGQKGAWENYGPYARRAVRRLVEIALESRAYDAGLEDLAGVPPTAPAEVRAEVSYVTGKAKEARGDTVGALAAYAEVPPVSRFWSQATYLSGLLQVERGNLREGESLFCKVADPKRQDRSAPVFADDRFFAVRDLARLALGRVAHEESRFDDARYYYYVVPRDSNRLAEALYEAATTRYEKKDYQGARELLDELVALKAHHRYEDEARILDAYIDLALCRFPEADKKLLAFIRDYEPVRDEARRLVGNESATRALLTAARSGGGPSGADASSAGSPVERQRAVAALVRVDPLYGEISRKRVVLEREAGGLRLALQTLNDMQRTFATTGGVRPVVEDKADPQEQAKDARLEIDGLRRQIAELDQARANANDVRALRAELAALETRLDAPSHQQRDAKRVDEGKGDVTDLFANDVALGDQLGRELPGIRAELLRAEMALASAALKRLDMRLSRLLRRARLGRIESVLGKKHALEVEIEGLSLGFLPKDALDSLDAARFLRDDEEYWPFEGDDWPDEFVGTEGLK